MNIAAAALLLWVSPSSCTSLLSWLPYAATHGAAGPGHSDPQCLGERGDCTLWEVQRFFFKGLVEQLTPDDSFSLPSFFLCPFHANPHCKRCL